MRRWIFLASLVAVACQPVDALRSWLFSRSVVRNANAQPRAGLPRVTQVDNDRVHTLLPPDAIPSIDEPKFVRASEATFMTDDEPVVGVVMGSVAKAYSTWHLDHHEIVNDAVGGQPLAVTW